MRAAAALASLLAGPLILAAPLKDDIGDRFHTTDGNSCIDWRLEIPSHPHHPHLKGFTSQGGIHIRCAQDVAHEALRELTYEIIYGTPNQDPECYDSDTTRALRMLKEAGRRAKSYKLYRKAIGVNWDRPAKAPAFMDMVSPAHRQVFIDECIERIQLIDKNLLDETWRQENPDIMETIIRRQIFVMDLDWLTGAQQLDREAGRLRNPSEHAKGEILLPTLESLLSVVAEINGQSM